MPVREQFAWVWLVTMVVSYGIYFTAIVLLEGRELSLWTELGMFAATAVSQLAILGVFSLIILSRQKGARKVDERDRAIEHRSAAIGYYVLMMGLIVVGCILPFYETPWGLVHNAIFAIVVAEITRQVLIVLWYRRGWNA